MIDIRPANFPGDLDVVRQLFKEYAAGIDVDLTFQDFGTELATLPGKYAPPAGRLLLAWHGVDVLGCVALRAHTGDTAEMKRLYVRPQARGQQLGRQLALAICNEARAAGYARICLDTLATMKSALHLYRSLGFASIAPYTFNPLEGAQFLALELRTTGGDPR